MNILMDSDCLIKLTKAGLKEVVCKYFRIFIPTAVEMEVVNEGKQHQCPDAAIVEKNIQHDKIVVIKSQGKYSNGDSALVSIFEPDSYDAVGTDDAKLTRKLKAIGIPFILPAIFILKLAQEKKLARLGFEYYVAKEYREGHVTLREVAKLLDMPLSNAIDLLNQMGVSGNIRARDVLSSLKSIEHPG